MLGALKCTCCYLWPTKFGSSPDTRHFASLAKQQFYQKVYQKGRREKKSGHFRCMDVLCFLSLVFFLCFSSFVFHCRVVVLKALAKLHRCRAADPGAGSTFVGFRPGPDPRHLLFSSFLWHPLSSTPWVHAVSWDSAPCSLRWISDAT